MFFYLFNLFNPILIAAAVLPAAFLMLKVYKKDKLEAEPPRMLLSLALLGVLASIIAMGLEWLGGTILDHILPMGTAYELLFYFIVVALSEEGAKYVLLKKKTWLSDNFNCQFDGIVYAVFVSLGFALAENIGYVSQYGFSTALIRAVTAIPGHACFGVFMGFWYSTAKKYDNFGYTEKSRRAASFSLLVPTILHGAYDYIATRATTGYTMFFIVFVIIMFLIAYRLVNRMAANDQYLY